MKKYDNYKNSGVEWLGDIPEHWEVKKVFHYFKAEKGKNAAILTKDYCGKIEGKFPVYSGQTENNGIMSSINQFEFDFEDDGCLFTTTVGAKAMTVSFLKSKFSLSQNCMIIVKRKKEIYSKFYFYHFQPIFHFFRSQIPDHMQASFRMEDLYKLKFYLPPFQEQTAIANFLDDKTTKIDQAIAIKQQQIALLQERRQILIHKAVTRGLNENVKLKDSGVEWIGEIPEHWEVKKMTNVCKIDTGATPDRSNSSYWQGNIPWIKTGEVNYELITSAEEFITIKGLKNSSTRLAPIGTLLMAMYGQGVTRGRVSILGIEATYNQACCAMLFNKNIHNKYAYYFFIMAYSYIRDGGNETSQMNISAGYISNLKILQPPIIEQQIIIEFIETASTKIFNAISLKEQEIEKLKEYKMSLIDGVVTGKVRVIS